MLTQLLKQFWSIHKSVGSLVKNLIQLEKTNKKQNKTNSLPNVPSKHWKLWGRLLRSSKRHHCIALVKIYWSHLKYMYYLLALCGASFESWMVQILPVHTDTGVLCYVEGEIRIQGKMLLIFFLTGACTLTIITNTITMRQQNSHVTMIP